jgi:beta-galactosidase
MRALRLLWLFLWAISSHLVYATSNGNTTEVTWDKYSLSVKGERVFIFAGEFHYMRLPVPEMWLDVFQKLRASGFNAVSSKYTSV